MADLERSNPAAALDLLALLRAAQPLYAVLDAARDGAVLDLLSGSEHESLYDGAEGDELAAVAPYLVRLPPESALLRALLDEGWGYRWGIFLTSEASFAEVRRHFRRFLLVEMPDGEKVRFRLYDPLVLARFLFACRGEEVGAVFGPVGRYHAETEDRALLATFAPGPERPVAAVTRVALPRPAPLPA